MATATSAPIPIPHTHPTELHKLIRERAWPAVVQRCRTTPHEVGSSSHLRNERGYTALHLLLAYNQCVAGAELAPVAAALLSAADEIAYGAAYRLGRGIGNEGGGVVDRAGARRNKNRIDKAEEDAEAEEEAGRMGGSWRLLLDRNNRAQWSPLHLMCVQGGIRDGKIPLLQTLLRMEAGEHDSDEEGAVLGRYRQRVLLLRDRQQRNLLHHLVGSLVPSLAAFGDAEFVAATAPALLFQRDARELTPLACVLSRLLAKPGTRGRHEISRFGNTDTDGLTRNHRMLRVLVGCMERAAPGGGAGAAARNTLQRACLLPRRHCPADGTLLTYLASALASKLEAEVRPDDHGADVAMASEADADGNRALHLFVSNRSYAVDDALDDAVDEAVDDGSAHLEEAEPGAPGHAAPQYHVEYSTLRELLRADGGAISAPNAKGQLPLHIAMQCGNRRAVAVLVVEYPACVLLDDGMDTLQVFLHILGCISTPCRMTGSPRKEGIPANTADRVELHQKCLTTMFDLIRARPAVVSLAGSGDPVLDSREDAAVVSLAGSGDPVLDSRKDAGGMAQKKKWWRKLTPFL